MRMVLLKPNDNTDESEKAIVGNTILVAQPSPQLIAAQLPPTEAEQALYFNVVYGTDRAVQGSNKLAKKKALIVDQKEYLERATLRSERCPLFADVPINTDAAQERLPETGVPYGIQRGAVEMDSLEYFAPNLSGPATHDTPFSGDKEDEDSANEEEREDEDATDAAKAPDALIADENANAEFLIGLDGSPDDDVKCLKSPLTEPF